MRYNGEERANPELFNPLQEEVLPALSATTRTYLSRLRSFFRTTLRAYLFVRLCGIARVHKFVKSDLDRIERERNSSELKEKSFVAKMFF